MKPDTWEVIANRDGTFDMLRQGELLHASIPDGWLEDQLGEYGFCGTEYREIRQQLKTTGKAAVTLLKITPPTARSGWKGRRTRGRIQI